MDNASRILALLLREEWRGGRGFLAADVDGEGNLVRAAAALGAGEPKRAERILDAMTRPTGDDAAVERALRAVAGALEWNWFPGGAGSVFEGENDVDRLAHDVLEPEDLDARMLVLVSNRLLKQLGNWRSIATGTRADTQLATPDVVVDPARTLLDDLVRLEATAAVGFAALAVADLEFRAGRADRAGPPLATAVEAYRANGDQTGVAACLMVQGDWALEPASHPEVLGERLDGPVVPGAPPRNLDYADKRYVEAERAFAAVGSTRGVAAVSLRVARLAGIGNDWTRAIQELDRCRTLAEEAGDGALAQLAAVHRALAGVVLGAEADPDAVGGDVASWANSVGSRSFARGLARLCHAKARRWRARDVLRARLALRTAEAINDGVGAVSEPDLVRAELVEQYGAANFRRASLVLSLLDLTEAEEAPQPVDELAWARQVDRAMAANRDASNLRDPDGIAAVRAHLDRLVDLGATLALDDLAAQMRSVARETSAQAEVMIPLYAGVAARARGDLPSAERSFEQAIAATMALGAAAGMLPVVVFGTMRRTPEALDLVEPLVSTGVLPTDHAASIFVRLGAYERALVVLASLPAPDHPPQGWKSWEWAALHAEARVGAGRYAEGLPIALRAIDEFEKHLAALSRDVLRTMATDDVTAAGLYTTAIRAHVALHQETGDTQQLAEAFRLSDRCRGMLLGDLVDVDAEAGADPRVVAAVRAWLQAGAELARTVEGLSDLHSAQTRRPAEARYEVRAAERMLDDVEAELKAVAPTLLAERRRLPETPALETIQRRLPTGTLLLQFHAYDDELVGWAVNRDNAEMRRRLAPTPMLTAQVQRFVRTLADPASSPDLRAEAASPLSDLLGPFTDAIEEHRRLVIVPYGPLSALPFHVLPFGGSDLAATHAVSYLPAAARVPDHDSAARTTGKGATALVVGNPAYTPGRLRDLPGAAVEASAVADLRGVDALVDRKADRRGVLGGLEGAHVVHLATHGLLREAAPYSAELALAGDESLTVPDLMGLDTDIDLAVLSACDSGRGRATAAGDVIGLTRALMSAGARELVVSLWPVDDRFACLTMVRFHEQLLAEVAPAEALADATRSVRALHRPEADEEYAKLRAAACGGEPGGPRSARDLRPPLPSPRADDPAHPYYWAPFVHVGV